MGPGTFRPVKTEEIEDHRMHAERFVVPPEAADAIDWSAPRLLCIAGDFTKYDEYAVQQINYERSLAEGRRVSGRKIGVTSGSSK